jgi:hypothetical protein
MLLDPTILTGGAMQRLGREASEMERIRNARGTFLMAARDAGGSTTGRLADGLTQALERLVQADLHYREAERLEALGLGDDGRAPAARARADRHNDACLELLTTRVPDAIENIRRELGDAEVDFERSLELFEAEMIDEIVSTDLSRRQAEIGARGIRETVALAREFGVAGICDRLQRDVRRLVEFRRERPEHNNPVTTIIGLSLWGLAATIYAACWAASGPGPCTDPTVIHVVVSLVGFGGLIILAGLGSEEQPESAPEPGPL